MSSFQWPPQGSPTWLYPVASAGDLPATGNTQGDVVVVTDTNTLYEWNGTSWIVLGSSGAATAIDGLFGDVTASGPGVVAATLTATTNSTLTQLAGGLTLLDPTADSPPDKEMLLLSRTGGSSSVGVKRGSAVTMHDADNPTYIGAIEAVRMSPDVDYSSTMSFSVNATGGSVSSFTGLSLALTLDNQARTVAANDIVLTLPNTTTPSLVLSVAAPTNPFGFPINTAIYNPVQDTNSTNSGMIIFTAQNTTDVQTGDIAIATGKNVGSTGASGSGDVLMITGNVDAAGTGTSGSLQFSTGEGPASGEIAFETGDASNSSSGSGGVIFQTGHTIDGMTGQITVSTGQPTGVGASGGVTLESGDTTTGTSGNIILESGMSTSSGTTGNILLTPGTTSGTRGVIQFQDGSEGTSGYVWTSTDTSGSGSWMAAGGGGSGANQTLSNLTSPTALNQDLIFAEAGAATIKTQDNLTGNTQPINIQTGNAENNLGSGAVNIFSGDTDDNGPSNANSGGINLYSADVGDGQPSSSGNTGSITVVTGNNNGTGQSGGLTFNTGSSANSVSGQINLTTGGANGESGNLGLSTGASATSNTGQIGFVTGNAVAGQAGSIVGEVGSSSQEDGGNISFDAGNTDTGNGGPMNLAAGSSSTSGNGGAVNVNAGNAASGVGGNIVLTAGSGTTAGKIQLVDDTIGTSGWLWTSIDGSGTGSWIASTAANTTLTNLGTTAINSTLSPATAGAVALGTNSKYWGNSYIQELEDASSVSSVSPFNRHLYDASGHASVAWSSRQLTYTDGTTVMVDWSVSSSVKLNAATTIGAVSTTPTHILNTATATPASGVGTLTNFPAGVSGNPTGFVTITINGGTAYIPYWT